MDSMKLNNMIEHFSDLTDGTEYFDYNGSGKSIPYIGFAWRNVYFGDNITLGYIPDHNFTGFMEDNKWGYHEITATEKEKLVIIAALEQMCDYWMENDGLREDFDPAFNGFLIAFGMLMDQIGENHREEILAK